MAARFLSRCSQLLNGQQKSAATTKERRKITFCMRIAELQEMPIHSRRHWRNGLIARTCTYAPIFQCVCMRAWSLDFLVKPATEWVWTNGSRGMALEVWIIHEDISLHSLPIPISRTTPLSFLLSHIFTATTIHPTRHFFASCLLYLLTPTANISIEAIII